MAFETVYQHAEVELDVDTDALLIGFPLIFEWRTDQPGDAMATRHAAPVNTELTTSGRRTVRIRFESSVKGQLYQAKLSGPVTGRLYGARVFARRLGSAAAWRWYVIPVVETPEGWSEGQLPIPATPEGWSEAGLPFGSVAPEPQWVDLPADEIA